MSIQKIKLISQNACQQFNTDLNQYLAKWSHKCNIKGQYMV